MTRRIGNIFGALAHSYKGTLWIYRLLKLGKYYFNLRFKQTSTKNFGPRSLMVMSPDSEGLGTAVVAGVVSNLTQPSGISYLSLYTFF